jgi:branched-subunit amino acid aminotransferase/4-amino-4-deoxychorismate lyase
MQGRVDPGQKLAYIDLQLTLSAHALHFAEGAFKMVRFDRFQEISRWNSP